MEIIINNGNQVGGSVTKITSGNNSIIIDFGEALPGNAETPHWDSVKEGVKAVFFTHNHGDHFAKFASIPLEITLYMSSVMKESELITLNTLINLKTTSQKDKIIYKKAKERLENNVELFEEDKEVKIGDLTITPYSVDHSVYDAYMFLIQDGKENLLHTGDFRTHGYRGKKFFKLLKTYVLKKAKKIDYLITEGTNITRNIPVLSEYDLQEKVNKLFDNHKKVFLLVPGTNLDTLATYINSANRYKLFTVCNGRVKKLIDLFEKTAGAKSKSYKLNNVFSFTPNKVLPKVNITQREYMHKKNFLFITGYRDYNLDIIREYINDEEKPVVVYAMWKGYIEDPSNPAYNKEMADFLDKCKTLGLEVLTEGYHTSGHASKKDIEELIKIVKPEKNIYPVHTDNQKAFESLNIPQDLKEKIIF